MRGIASAARSPTQTEPAPAASARRPRRRRHGSRARPCACAVDGRHGEAAASRRTRRQHPHGALARRDRAVDAGRDLDGPADRARGLGVDAQDVSSNGSATHTPPSPTAIRCVGHVHRDRPADRPAGVRVEALHTALEPPAGRRRRRSCRPGRSRSPAARPPSPCTGTAVSPCRSQAVWPPISRSCVPGTGTTSSETWLASTHRRRGLREEHRRPTRRRARPPPPPRRAGRGEPPRGHGPGQLGRRGLVGRARLARRARSGDPAIAAARSSGGRAPSATAARRAAAKSAPLAKRSAGSLAIARRIASSRASVAGWPRSPSDGGGSCACAHMTADSVSRTYGARPVSAV